MKKLFSTTLHHKSVDISLLLLRVLSSSFMLTHGIKKIDKYSQPVLKFADPLGIGTSASLGLTIFAEVGCSILLIVGLATRLAAIPLIITMLVIVFVVHVNDDFGKQELGLFYLLSYTILLLAGPGKYSLDHVISKKL